MSDSPQMETKKIAPDSDDSLSPWSKTIDIAGALFLLVLLYLLYDEVWIFSGWTLGVRLILFFALIPYPVIHYSKRYIYKAYKKKDKIKRQYIPTELLKECQQAIRYFGLQGENISVTPASTALIVVNDASTTNNSANTNSQPTTVTIPADSYVFKKDDTIAVALAALEGKIINRDPLLPIEKASLYVIHDYLSMRISNYDNDMTIESIDEAIESSSTRSVSFNYYFGTVFIFVLCVVFHSLFMTISGDCNKTIQLQKTFYTLLANTGVKHDTTSDACDSVHTTINDTIKKPHNSTIVKSKLLHKGTTESKTESIKPHSDAQSLQDSINTIKDSILLLKNELISSIIWLRTESKLSPIPIRMQGAKWTKDFQAYQQDSLFYVSINTIKNDKAIYTKGLLSDNLVRLQGNIDRYVYMATQVSNILSMFILPMLYGLAGAFLWVIRILSQQVKTFDLTWKKLIRHRARLIMGLFVGMFFGYLHPMSSTTSISSYVFAFIGGYNVEILFSALDKIVDTFSTSLATKTKGGK